jgi:very-short-patch-repair endonuclease
MATTHPGSQRFFDAIHGKDVATHRDATKAIRELAERQHGVVAHRQLIALGLGAGLIEDRVRSGRLLPLHQGVFAVGHRRIGLHGEWMAATLACGPAAVLSHGSALHLWGVRRSRGAIEVSRVSGHRRPHGLRLHQPRVIPPGDVTEHEGIPVTSLERALADTAGRFDDRQMERLLVEADRSGQLSWPTLQAVLDRPGGRKGIGRLRRIAAEVDPRAAETRSPPEVDFLALCRKSRLPLPQVNVIVEGRLVDFFWPQARLVVETDSYAYHGDRSAFERDHESTVALMAAGYTVRRTTCRMLERNPRPFMLLVRQALESEKPPNR